MARRYEEVVDLPKHSNLKYFGEVVAFLHKTASVTETAGRIKTDDGTIDEASLADAVAVMEPTETVEAVEVSMATPGGMSVFLVSGFSFPPTVAVSGSSQTEVLGVAEALRRFVKKTTPPLSRPKAVSVTFQDHLDVDVIPAFAAIGATAVPTTTTPPPRRSSLRRKVASWWRGNSSAVYVEVVGGLAVIAVAAAVTALWFF